MDRPLKIKVCGLRDPRNIEEICSLEPDFVGYIFYPGSGRFVGEHPDSAIFRIPGPGIAKVGVFVNEEISVVKRIYGLYRLEVVQLHGSESPAYCEELEGAGITVMKALKPGSSEAAGDMDLYRQGVTYLLFDSPGTGYGGTGRKFNWDLLEAQPVPLPFMLGGGIGPGDVAAIRKLEHEALYGIDVNSRFERSPGLKDVDLLKGFITGIRASGKVD